MSGIEIEELSLSDIYDLSLEVFTKNGCNKNNAIRPKLRESYLSNKPPWPGNIEPESLTLNVLFSLDINKSPNNVKIDIKKENKLITKILFKSK